MKLAPNAIYAIKNRDSINLFHVTENGDIGIAMYRDLRGRCTECMDGKVSMIHNTFHFPATPKHNHNHWLHDLESRGVIVASHVTNPQKLTSRELRKMARKAA